MREVVADLFVVADELGDRDVGVDAIEGAARAGGHGGGVTLVVDDEVGGEVGELLAFVGLFFEARAGVDGVEAGELRKRAEKHGADRVAGVAVLGVVDDTDDFKRAGHAAVFAEVGADGVLAFEVLVDERFVDDSDVGAGCGILLADTATQENAHAERLEVVGANDAVTCILPGVRVAAGDGDAGTPVVERHGRVGAVGDVLHAGGSRRTAGRTGGRGC